MKIQRKTLIKYLLLSYLAYAIVICLGGIILSMFVDTMNITSQYILEFIITVLAFVALGTTYKLLSVNFYTSLIKSVKFYKQVITLLLIVAIYNLIYYLTNDQEITNIILIIALIASAKLFLGLHSMLSGLLPQKLDGFISITYMLLGFIPVYLLSSTVFTYIYYGSLSSVATTKYGLIAPKMFFVDLILFMITVYVIQTINNRKLNNDNLDLRVF